MSRGYKYGIRYIPSIGKLNDPATSFYQAMRGVQLTQVSRVEMMFDPFTGKQAESIRSFAFHLDTPKIRQTNFKCNVKLNVVCDRSEPSMQVKFNNGDNALFKTQNLTAQEIADEFKVLCGIYERKAAEEESKKKRR